MSTRALQTGHKGLTLGQGFSCGGGDNPHWLNVLWTDTEMNFKCSQKPLYAREIYLGGIRDANKSLYEDKRKKMNSKDMLIKGLNNHLLTSLKYYL